MGDRRMAQIEMKDGSLYVYTHWDGDELRERAKAAIITAHERWDDEPYAARILVDQLIAPARDQTTGYGLLLKPDAEDEYNDNKPSIIIDLVEKRLDILGKGPETISFDDLVKNKT